MKARTLAIAGGKCRRDLDEPKVWFSSAESFARILSEPLSKPERVGNEAA